MSLLAVGTTWFNISILTTLGGRIHAVESESLFPWRSKWLTQSPKHRGRYIYSFKFKRVLLCFLLSFSYIRAEWKDSVVGWPCLVPGLEIFPWRAASGAAYKPQRASSEPSPPRQQGILKEQAPVQLGKLYFVAEYEPYKTLDGSLQRVWKAVSVLLCRPFPLAPPAGAPRRVVSAAWVPSLVGAGVCCSPRTRVQNVHSSAWCSWLGAA